jgi:hypothetical protein
MSPRRERGDRHRRVEVDRATTWEQDFRGLAATQPGRAATLAVLVQMRIAMMRIALRPLPE